MADRKDYFENIGGWLKVIEFENELTVGTVLRWLVNEETQLIICPHAEEETWIYIRADNPLIGRFENYPIDGIDVSDNRLKIWLSAMGL